MKEEDDSSERRGAYHYYRSDKMKKFENLFLLVGKSINDRQKLQTNQILLSQIMT